MRYRIKDYTAYVGRGVAVAPDSGLGDLGNVYFPIHIIADCHKDISQLTEKQLKESILLVYNETTGTLYTSTKNKGKIQGVSVKDGTKINMWFKSTDIDTMPNSEFTDSINQQNITDELRVEIDLGDDLSPIAKEETLTQVQSKVEEVGNKIDNIKLPEIDTTELASKDLERFFGVKPIEGYEFMTAEEVCSTLEEIMTTMDINLTPEMATNITQNTLKQFGNE